MASYWYNKSGQEIPEDADLWAKTARIEALDFEPDSNGNIKTNSDFDMIGGDSLAFGDSSGPVRTVGTGSVFIGTDLSGNIGNSSTIVGKSLDPNGHNRVELYGVNLTAESDDQTIIGDNISGGNNANMVVLYGDNSSRTIPDGSYANSTIALSEKFVQLSNDNSTLPESGVSNAAGHNFSYVYSYQHGGAGDELIVSIPCLHDTNEKTNVFVHFKIIGSNLPDLDANADTGVIDFSVLVRGDTSGTPVSSSYADFVGNPVNSYDSSAGGIFAPESFNTPPGGNDNMVYAYNSGFLDVFYDPTTGSNSPYFNGDPIFFNIKADVMFIPFA